jgi:hypothetical protein
VDPNASAIDAEPPSNYIFYDDFRYDINVPFKAKNLNTGRIEYSGQHAPSVLQDIIDALSFRDINLFIKNTGKPYGIDTQVKLPISSAHSLSVKSNKAELKRTAVLDSILDTNSITGEKIF